MSTSQERISVEIMSNDTKRKFNLFVEKFNALCLVSLFHRTIVRSNITKEFIFENHRVYYEELMSDDQSQKNYNEIYFNQSEIEKIKNKKQENEWIQMEIDSIKSAAQKNSSLETWASENESFVRFYIVTNEEYFDPIQLQSKFIVKTNSYTNNQPLPQISQLVPQFPQSQQPIEHPNDPISLMNKPNMTMYVDQPSNVPSTMYPSVCENEQQSNNKDDDSQTEMSDESFQTYCDMGLEDRKLVSKLHAKHDGDVANIVQEYFEIKQIK